MPSNLDLRNCDNMELMAQFPDKYFELAIVDPEFGIGIGKSPRLVKDKGLNIKDWDDKPINDIYFNELYRVSRNQIILGGNYYELKGNKHCIIWDKLQPENLSFGMFDYAWTSFNGANKIFRYSNKKDSISWHPTSKPIALYKWLLKNYAKPGDKILDTHLGSASIAIACYDLGFDLTGCELDKDYFDEAMKRIENHKKQKVIRFPNADADIYTQQKLF